MKIPIEGAGTTGAIERWILDILILIVLRLCKNRDWLYERYGSDRSGVAVYECCPSGEGRVKE